MWVYNAAQTSDFCAKTCLKFRLDARPNNGPYPQCTLDDCLECDETNAGPLFAKIAARTRRRSGLISKIARPCEDILFVDHQNPCDVVQGIEREFEQGDVCKLKDPQAEPECVTITTDLGLRSYEAPSNGKFFDLPFNDEGIYTTIYGKCKKYSTRKAREGFWRYVADEVLGPAFTAASTFSLIACITGTFMWIFLWVACCVAFPRNFWFVCTGLFILCGILELCTLVFTLSSVCTDSGCSFGYAATCAIMAGIMWFTTAGLCCKTGVDDTANAYRPVIFDVLVTEYSQPDGTVLTEKVTTRSNGTSVVERTTFVKKSVVDENSADSVETGVMAPQIGAMNGGNASPVGGEESQTSHASISENSGDDVKKDN